MPPEEPRFLRQSQNRRLHQIQQGGGIKADPHDQGNHGQGDQAGGKRQVDGAAGRSGSSR
jgi:hypothetical protein